MQIFLIALLITILAISFLSLIALVLYVFVGFWCAMNSDYIERARIIKRIKQKREMEKDEQTYTLRRI